MLELLNSLKDNQTVAAVYTDINRPDFFSVGCILSACEDGVLMSHLGIRGEFDGYSAQRTDAVYRVETDSSYVDRIKKLSGLKGTVLKKDIDITSLPFESIVNYAVSSRHIAAISIDDDIDDIVGYIDKYEGGKLYITQVSKNGITDGNTVIYLDDVLTIVAEDVDCTDLELLNKNIE